MAIPALDPSEARAAFERLQYGVQLTAVCTVYSSPRCVGLSLLARGVGLSLLARGVVYSFPFTAVCRFQEKLSDHALF